MCTRFVKFYYFTIAMKNFYYYKVIIKFNFLFKVGKIEDVYF